MTNDTSTTGTPERDITIPRHAPAAVDSSPKLVDLDAVLKMLDRLKGELADRVLERLRADIENSAPELAAKELERSGVVKKLATAEIDARAKVVGKWIGAVSVVVALVGFASLAALVDGVVDRRVVAAFDKQANRLEGLGDRLEKDRQEAMKHLTSVVTDLHGEVNRSVLQASQAVQTARFGAENEIRKVTEESRKQMDEHRAKVFTELDEKSKTHRAELEAQATGFAERFKKLSDEAKVEIASSLERSIRAIHDATDEGKKDLLRTSLRPNEKPEARADGGGASAESGLDDAMLMVFDAMDRRVYEDVVDRATKLALQGNGQAAAVLQQVLLNPNRFRANLLAICRTILDPKRPLQDRARVATEVLVAGVLAGDPEIVNLVRKERDENVMVRLTWSEFDQFLELAARWRPADPDSVTAVHEQFARVAAGDLTGVGLSNLLAVAKLVGIQREHLLDIEEKVTRAVTVGLDGRGGLIDRSSDYALAWAVMSALVAAPKRDAEFLVPVADHVDKYVFDKGHEQLDPWGLKAVLAQARL
jgi:hypothetical protein